LAEPKLSKPDRKLLSDNMEYKPFPYKVSFLFFNSQEVIVYLFLLIFLPSLIFWIQFRQAKISYTGSLMAKVYFQLDNGPSIPRNFDFGQFPIMVKVGNLVLCSIWFWFLKFIKFCVCLNQFMCE
jgi:hypothetical protein